MRVVWWGTYDTGKPRTRILLRGLKENGVNITECHADVWGGIEDKSQVKGLDKKIYFGLRWLLSYPSLVWRFLRLPKPDVVVIGYLGQLDVLVLWPFARLRGVPVVWDAFLSLYNTVVDDRKMVGSKHPLAYVIYAWEWLACRATDMVVLDTNSHAVYFVEKFKIPQEKTGAVLVGAETDVFPAIRYSSASDVAERKLTVLFYGQFIPLHGIETIILAARLLENEPVMWVLIGQGQQEARIRDMLAEHPLPKLNWITWVPYRELNGWLHRADICLGIFSESEKASRVIPNKVFQILSSGIPLITRDSPAIRELLSPDMPGVFLVPPASPSALADAIYKFSAERGLLGDKILHREIAGEICAKAIGSSFLNLMAGALQENADNTV